jgi:rod shape determining protein RodA
MAIRFRAPSLDWPSVWAALGLVLIGLSTVYSATTVPGAHEGLWLRQLLWFGVALFVSYLASSLHYRVYDSIAYALYGVSIVMLAAVLVVGTSVMGAKRWIDLGPIRFQPSEIAKIATVFVLARRFDDRKLDLTRVRHWLPPLLITLLPMALVAKEPDLGTSLSFPVILIAMYFWAGMPAGQLLLGLSPAFNVALFFITGSLWWFA